jgi:NADH-quinone oxidoreductase subunit D
VSLAAPTSTEDRFRLERRDAEADLMVLNFGPQHPSTHGVFRIKLFLDGEIVVKAVPYVGYLHRGVEKLCEQLTYAQVTPIVDKNDYVSPMINEQALNMAFERMLGIEVPRRARWIRTTFAELQRIASHLLWLGTFALDLGGALGGGATAFMWCFRERELILDLFEQVTGSRFHYSTHSVGGNRHDVPAGWAKDVHAALDVIAQRLDEHEKLTIDTRIFRERTVGVGTLSRELAIALGQTGPILRACGVSHDLRRDAPYHAYDEVKVNVVTAEGGDCFARARVRIGEMRESIRLSRLLVDGIPEGPIMGGRGGIKTYTQIRIAQGQAYVAVESPRGELGTWVIAGGAERGAAPYRLKIRAPSFTALSALPHVLPGHHLSDVVAILGSLDPIMGDCDR